MWAATAKQEITLTAPMDGLDSSRGPGCDTPAPKNITGSWNILGGLNRKYGETKRRKRKIMWFNPPYSKNISTKAGNQFLKLIIKLFPRHHKFYKLFTKNNVKKTTAARPTWKTLLIRTTQK